MRPQTGTRPLPRSQKPPLKTVGASSSTAKRPGSITNVTLPSDSFPVDASSVQPLTLEEDFGSQRKRQILFFGCFTTISIVVVVSIVVAVILGFQQQRDPEPIPGTNSLSFDGPKKVPTSAPTTDRTANVMEYMIERGVSTRDAMEDQGSPQNRAALWIGQEDVLNLNVSKMLAAGKYYDNTDKLDPLIQRYVLAVFYYATNGDSWKKCSADSMPTVCTSSPWLSGQSECEWKGVICDKSTGEATHLLLEVVYQLNGVLPQEITQLSKLQELSLPVNQLRGSIPPWISRLSQLKVLRLYENKLNGTLPDELFEMGSSLETLSLRNNSFTGTLPEKVAQLANLTLLSAGWNRFRGSIPLSLGELPLRTFVQ